MQDAEFNELAGRIDAVAKALLNLTAALEMQGFIDGPHLSGSWRNAARTTRPSPVSQASHRILQELADLLDDARAARQSRAR